MQIKKAFLIGAFVAVSIIALLYGISPPWFATLSNFPTDGFRGWFGGDAFVPSGAPTNRDPNSG